MPMFSQHKRKPNTQLERHTLSQNELKDKYQVEDGTGWAEFQRQLNIIPGGQEKIADRENIARPPPDRNRVRSDPDGC